MQKNNLLIELLCEELPPKTQKKLSDTFAEFIVEKLNDNKLIDQKSYDVISTPRRMGVIIQNVISQANNELKRIKLMPKKIGFDANDKPTNPLLKKLESIGETEAVLKNIIYDQENDQEVLYLDKEFEGVSLKAILPEIVEESIKNLPIAKTMSYQLDDGWSTVNFVRPAKNILVKYGSENLNINILGLTSNNQTLGHRFMSNNQVLTINHVDDYASQLAKEGNVITSFDQRKKRIWDGINSAVKKIDTTFHVKEDHGLLEEVTSLVEMPEIMIGHFEEKYLQVPQECLELTMKANQKYFPILNSKGGLTNFFIITSNLNPKNQQKIIEGNEKVIRPRLADAEFFFKKDQEQSLSYFADKLTAITYHNKLGSQYDRAVRVAKIALEINKSLNLKLKDNFEKLALYCKADLLSLMVGEFPELQGVMGHYYAHNQGESQSFSQAIEDHYKPRFSGDTLPKDSLGDCMALAEKIETLISLFSINEKPSGERDPFGLRRNAIGIIRILVEKNIPLDLISIIRKFYPNEQNNDVDDLINFIKDRLKNFLKDNKYNALEVEAVTEPIPHQFNTIIKKLEAIQEFQKLKEAEALISSNKRVSNILKNYNYQKSIAINKSLLVETEEKELANYLDQIGPDTLKKIDQENYIDALSNLVKLKNPIDEFFDHVMVNAEDDKVKQNRYNLLKMLKDTMNAVADISKLSNS